MQCLILKLTDYNYKMATVKLILIAVIFQQALSQTIVYLADHFDPNYTDPCLEDTGELCQFCCLDITHMCSTHIQWCAPI